MIISIVVAIAQNNGIGKNNQLLWHLPADLKHFKDITTGNTIIMGRKTYDSIGKPLPNRRNIVITRNTGAVIPGVEIVHNLTDAFALCAGTAEVFVIGGAEIYNQALDYCHKIYLTVVKGDFEADAFFPLINSAQWEETESVSHEPDEKNKLGYTFSTLVRI